MGSLLYAFLLFSTPVKPLIFIYIIFAAFYSTLFSNVLKKLGIFEWNYGDFIVPYIIYFSWFAFVTWAYYKFNLFEEQKQHNSI